LNSTKARLVLGWKSTVDLQNGLEKTVSWYKSYLVGK
jgi:nucleoside-diphosphate-sugar epimerase